MKEGPSFYRGEAPTKSNNRFDTFEGLSVEVRRVASSERDCEARRERVRFRKVIILERNWEMKRMSVERSLP